MNAIDKAKLDLTVAYYIYDHFSDMYAIIEHFASMDYSPTEIEYLTTEIKKQVSYLSKTISENAKLVIGNSERQKNVAKVREMLATFPLNYDKLDVDINELTTFLYGE